MMRIKRWMCKKVRAGLRWSVTQATQDDFRERRRCEVFYYAEVNDEMVAIGQCILREHDSGKHLLEGNFLVSMTGKG